MEWIRLGPESNIYRCIHRVYMVKLYWRVKVNRKWSWKPLVGKWMTADDIVRDLIAYNKCEDPMGEEE